MSYRIEYDGSHSLRQGWVAKEDLRFYPLDGVSRKLEIFARKLRYDGLDTAVADATEHLRSETPLARTEHVVFHGHV